MHIFFGLSILPNQINFMSICGIPEIEVTELIHPIILLNIDIMMTIKVEITAWTIDSWDTGMNHKVDILDSSWDREI